ncbi:hypothetical protein MBANPS3_007064, partial [Mucor bainieri]
IHVVLRKEGVKAELCEAQHYSIVVGTSRFGCCAQKPGHTVMSWCGKEVHSLQIIKSQATLLKLTLSKLTKKWSVVEARSAEIPVNWATRYHWLPMFELMATLVVR